MPKHRVGPFSSPSLRLQRKLIPGAVRGELGATALAHGAAGAAVFVELACAERVFYAPHACVNRVLDTCQINIAHVQGREKARASRRFLGARGRLEPAISRWS
eukprot:4459844-Pyramimonas_sp.AAC.1